MVASVLVVCRANQGRSPVLAELLRLQAARMDADVQVTSSGLEARPGMPVLPAMTKAWRHRGYGGFYHASRGFDAKEARLAELTLVFEAAQRSRIVNEVPALVGQVFTVREATRLISSPRWDPAWAGSSFVMTRLHRLRGYVEPADDDTPDPARMRRAACARLLTELERSAQLIGEALFTPRDGSGPHSSSSSTTSP